MIKYFFLGIPAKEISSLQLEAIAAITPNVMKTMNQNKLEYFTKQQIYRMTQKTRRIFMLRMQLKNSLSTNQISQRKFGFSLKPCVHLLVVNVVFLFSKNKQSSLQICSQ